MKIADNWTLSMSNVQWVQRSGIMAGKMWSGATNVLVRRSVIAKAK